MTQQVSDLETIVVDSNWKRRGLIMAVGDHTTFKVNQNGRNGNWSSELVVDFLQGIKRIAAYVRFRASDLYPTNAARRILRFYPELPEQVTRQDLEYFATNLLDPVKLTFLFGVEHPRMIFNRGLKPEEMYAALREAARDSDEKTLTFVYLLAHSNGRFLTNTSLSKFGVMQQDVVQIPFLREYLEKVPEQRIYEPIEIAERLKRSRGVTILYVNSCSAGDLFDGIFPPRTLYMATSGTGELDCGIFANGRFGRYIQQQYDNNWELKRVKETEIEGGKKVRIPLPPNLVEQANRIKTALGSDTVFPPYSTVLTKGDLRLQIQTPPFV